MTIITTLSVLASESDGKPIASDNLSHGDCYSAPLISLAICGWVLTCMYVVKTVCSIQSDLDLRVNNNKIIDPMLECELYLYIYTFDKSFPIHLCKLPGDVTNVKINASSNLKALKIKMYSSKCNLTLEWAEEAILVNRQNYFANLPDTVNVRKDKIESTKHVLTKGKTFKLVATNNSKVATALCNDITIYPKENVLNRLTRLRRASEQNILEETGLIEY